MSDTAIYRLTQEVRDSIRKLSYEFSARENRRVSQGEIITMAIDALKEKLASSTS
jgi:hypothetical protein